MFRRPKRASHSIDMAPLIDVVFLLLIFFMLTSSFTPPSLPLTLPKAKPAGEPPKPAPVVSIDREGRMALDGREVTLETLPGALQEALDGDERRAVHVRGDRGVDYGSVLELMTATRAAGATQINLIYESEAAP